MAVAAQQRLLHACRADTCLKSCGRTHVHGRVCECELMVTARLFGAAVTVPACLAWERPTGEPAHAAAAHAAPVGLAVPALLLSAWSEVQGFLFVSEVQLPA
jgi:hypothetical protein